MVTIGPGGGDKTPGKRVIRPTIDVSQAQESILEQLRQGNLVVLVTSDPKYLPSKDKVIEALEVAFAKDPTNGDLAGFIVSRMGAAPDAQKKLNEAEILKAAERAIVLKGSLNHLNLGHLDLLKRSSTNLDIKAYAAALLDRDNRPAYVQGRRLSFEEFTARNKKSQ